jgi:F-box protein 21
VESKSADLIMSGGRLTSLPDEILRSICFFVGWRDALQLQSTCHHLSNVASEHLLWKYYCQLTFEFWSPSHCISSKIVDAGFLGWRELFREHLEANVKTSHLLNQIISSEKARISKLEAIVDIGDDAKDVLLENLYSKVENDHLARR